MGITGLQPRKYRAGLQHRAQGMVGRQRHLVDHFCGAHQFRCLVGEVRHPDHLDQHPGGLFAVAVVDQFGA